MAFNKLAKGAKTLILVVLVSAIAAGLLTVMIWTQPDFLNMLVQGNYWFVFTTFMSCWLLASIIAIIILSCATHRPEGSIAGTLADE